MDTGFEEPSRAARKAALGVGLVPPPGPASYLTHAWVWANNPAGMFADFNPKVSCS